jgi:hypothetical protein
MNQIPTPPNLSGPQAALLIELIDWLVDALIDLQGSIRRTYYPWGEEPAKEWPDDLPF